MSQQEDYIEGEVRKTVMRFENNKNLKSVMLSYGDKPTSVRVANGLRRAGFTCTLEKRNKKKFVILVEDNGD